MRQASFAAGSSERGCLAFNITYLLQSPLTEALPWLRTNGERAS